MGYGAAPDLVIIRAYDETNFRHLMQEGIAIGERELAMMSDVARSRFAYLTDEELDDLFLFLQDMAEKAGSPLPGLDSDSISRNIDH